MNITKRTKINDEDRIRSFVVSNLFLLFSATIFSLMRWQVVFASKCDRVSQRPTLNECVETYPCFMHRTLTEEKFSSILYAERLEDKIGNRFIFSSFKWSSNVHHSYFVSILLTIFTWIWAKVREENDLELEFRWFYHAYQFINLAPQDIFLMSEI